MWVRLPPTAPILPQITMLATELKTGAIFKEGGDPWLVEKYDHIKTARGGANVRVKARNLLTDQVLEKRYQSTAKVENADVLRKNIQYLYQDNGFHFMDPDTFEQFRLTDKAVGEKSRFLKEGEQVQVMFYEGKPVSIELPNTMVFEIEDTPPGYKGNTVSNVFKDATLTNGTKVKVPSFAKSGDKIKINTSTGEYVSKA